MRKRFEQQLTLGQKIIEDLPIGGKKKGKLEELIIALKAIYCSLEYNHQLFCVLDKYLVAPKKQPQKKGWNYGAFLFLTKLEWD